MLNNFFRFRNCFSALLQISLDQACQVIKVEEENIRQRSGILLNIPRKSKVNKKGGKRK